MKLTLEKEILKNVFSKLRVALPPSAINPSLEHFLFEVNKTSLLLKATNGQIAVVWKSDKIHNNEEFTFSLPGNTLSGLVSSLDDSTINFAYDPSSKEVTLTCGKFVWESSSGNADSFPAFSTPKDLEEIKLPENFSYLLQTVYFSISNDVGKPDLNSLCIDINKDGAKGVTLISTDRNRLSCASFSSEYSDSLRLVVPKSAVTEILKLNPSSMLVGKEKDRVYFKSEDSTGTFIFWAALTNYAYPDIYAYLTNSFKEEKEIKVKRVDLIKSLKRIKATSAAGIRSATLDFSPDKIIISSSSAINKTKEEIDVAYQDKDHVPVSFNVNLDFALEYLNTEVAMEISFKSITGKCLIFDKNGYRHVLSVNS